MILVTHQVQYIKNVKKILLFEDGKIKMQGTYDELKNNGMDFDEIIKQYQGDKEDKKDDIFGDDSKDPDENFEPAIENNYEDQDYEDHKLPPIDKKHIEKPDENNQVDIINQTDSNILDKKDVNIIEKEAKDEGQVSIKTWYRTFKYGLGLFGMFIIIFLGLLAAFLNLVCNFVIGEWAKQDEDDQEDSSYYNLFWIIVVVFIMLSLGLVLSLVFLFSSHEKLIGFDLWVINSLSILAINFDIIMEEQFSIHYIFNDWFLQKIFLYYIVSVVEMFCSL